MAADFEYLRSERVRLRAFRRKAGIVSISYVWISTASGLNQEVQTFSAVTIKADLVNLNSVYLVSPLFISTVLAKETRRQAAVQLLQMKGAGSGKHSIDAIEIRIYT
ncbi:hypothetical protein [Paenibacillus sp. HW567]|uniref:hypothetical protein n=1 Tax=Paenibacillus sp. HW567 TaxID=1034769 RepID=UPI0003786165|nr:hypothetical protein [Paenibacillus sp. HW567]